MARVRVGARVAVLEEGGGVGGAPRGSDAPRRAAHSSVRLGPPHCTHCTYRLRTHRPRLQLGTTTQLRLGRAAAGHPNPWGVTDPRVSRLHARVCAGPGAPTITAEGANPCVLIKALTGAQRRP